MRSLALLLSMQTALAGFLLDGSGGFLLNTIGGKILISDGVHTLWFESTWGTRQRVKAWFDVKADGSGIVIWGEGIEDNAPVTATEIVYVLSTGQRVSLAKCAASECSVDWPTARMPAGNNEILFIMTSADKNPNGTPKLYGATTRITKP